MFIRDVLYISTYYFANNRKQKYELVFKLFIYKEYFATTLVTALSVKQNPHAGTDMGACLLSMRFYSPCTRMTRISTGSAKRK